MKNKKGFTLIELLVVIAVIGLLASIVLVSINSARKKARDARRLSDLRQIEKALEMYYDDNNVYPPTGGNWQYAPNFLPSYLVNTGIMSRVPDDPSPTTGWCMGGRLSYLYSSPGWSSPVVSGTNCDYMFEFCLENRNDDAGIGPFSCAGRYCYNRVFGCR